MLPNRVRAALRLPSLHAPHKDAGERGIWRGPPDHREVGRGNTDPFRPFQFHVDLSGTRAVAAVLALSRHRPVNVATVVDALFAWFLLSSIGVSLFHNFVFHVFFGDMAARSIGWAPSPFQAEVGMASLGFAVVGFLAFRGSFGLRVAAVVGPACFLLGAAAGHVHQMITTHNFAPGNAGVIFYTDIAIPAAGLVLLWLQYRLRRQVPAFGGLARSSA
jgi:hypothetical protein